MTHVVGPKGQVVIEKEIRDKLGIKPGWLVLQNLTGDHVELYFVPPEHRRSLKGSLEKYINSDITSEKDWDEARKWAWERNLDERFPEDGLEVRHNL